MTKKQFEKYHKDIKDCYGKPIKVGDIVTVCYCSNPYIGIVHHFGKNTVVVKFKAHTLDVIWKGNKRSEYIMKLNEDCDNYPELKNVLDDYGKSILKLPSM